MNCYPSNDDADKPFVDLPVNPMPDGWIPDEPGTNPEQDEEVRQWATRFINANE